MRRFFIAIGAGLAMFAVWAAARRRRGDDLGSVSSTLISEHVAHDVVP
jgi:hypothetical protein